MKRLLIFVFSVMVTFTNCRYDAAQAIDQSIVPDLDSDSPIYVAEMEAAHRKARLLSHEVICFNLDITFGDRRSEIKIITTTNSSDILIDKKDGPVTIVSEGKVYTNADSTLWQSERFGVYTWQYFFMAPYKFSDQGTRWDRLPNIQIEGRDMERSQLTFEAGTGDAPDDWYIVHTDPDVGLVQYIGYIVTAGGRSVAEAEQGAHAIGYSAYEEVDGIPIAREWTFYNYDKVKGLGDQIGHVKVKNVELMDKTDQFVIADDFVKI